MIYDSFIKIAPEVVAVAIGFAIRHFLMPFIAGKETADLLKHIREQQMTKDQLAELKYNLAETRHWIEIHTLACPYASQRVREIKQNLRNITGGGPK